MRVDQDVLAVLSASECEGNALKLPGQLDRKLYEKTNKALVAAGGKWTRGKGAHLFPISAAESIDQIIVTGEIVDKKAELGAFFTPPALAAEIVQMADIKRGMRVLEPSAGEGAILREAMRVGGICWAVEIDPAHCKKLTELLHPSGVCKPSDFLSCPVPGRGFEAFDRVVMNPPFAMQADIKHVTHAFDFLKSGGRLVAIMGAGVLFRQDKSATTFRALVDDCGGTIDPLPAGSFKESGTMANTVVVVLDKP